MKTVCPHKYHHNGFAVHIVGTSKPKNLHLALSKEHNINFTDAS